MRVDVGIKSVLAPLLEDETNASAGLYGINSKSLELIANAADMAVDCSVFDYPIHQLVARVNTTRFAEHYFENMKLILGERDFLVFPEDAMLT
tara:strand:+ start:1041 stop:1319 length:279 start_codon:yes stop_codon:yes gene_type:complete